MTRGKGRPKGYAFWHPKGESTRRLEHVYEELEKVRDTWPDTQRQILYLLISAHPDEYSKADEDAIENVINRARRAQGPTGWLWDAIADGRSTESWPSSYSSASAYLHNEIGYIEEIQFDRQRGHTFVELWLETEGMVDQMTRAAHPFGVPIFTSSGTRTITARHKLANRIVERYLKDTRTVVLQIGDLDVKGVEILREFEEDVICMLRDQDIEGRETVEFKTVAITPKQAMEENVLWQQASGLPNDWIWPGIVQAEAIHPRRLLEIARETIIQNVDARAQEEARREETAFRERYSGVLASLVNSL